MSGRRVHLDATKPNDVGSTGYCGAIVCDTHADLSRVTCRDCRRLMHVGQPPRAPRAKKPKAQNETALDRVIRTLLKPKADAPPVLTDRPFEGDNRTVWELSCKGALDGRCSRGNRCDICRWELQAEQFEHADPDRFENGRVKYESPEERPRWNSENTALVAYAEWEQHDRHAPSAIAGILARLERGFDCDGGLARPEDPLQRRAGEVAAVGKALAVAYPTGGHPTLNQRQLIALLLVRTPGVIPVERGEQQAKLPDYDDLSVRLAVPPGELQALVNTGRARVAADLFGRGLIPRPKERRRDAPGGSRAFAAQQDIEVEG
jgi:hypothetical protein